MSIGKRVQALREQNNHTQSALAELLNVPPRTYASWEREERSFPVDILVRIAQIYGVSADHLLGMEKAAQQALDGQISQLVQLASRLTPENQGKLRSYLGYLLEREQPGTQAPHAAPRETDA